MNFISLDDIINMPLLKGGVVGPTGTAPFVFTASYNKEGADPSEDLGGQGWRMVLGTTMGRTAVAALKALIEDAGDILHRDIQCPAC